jgi:hypothetical protein
MNKFIPLLLIIMSMASCGRLDLNEMGIMPEAQASSAAVDPATSEDYSYQFSGHRCNTGKHSARTFSEICQLLKDNEVNQYCASDKRENLFLSAECSGTF